MKRHSGIKRVGGSKSYLNKEILINEMKRLSRLLKKTPSASEIRNYGIYTVVTFKNYFGSLANAQKEAGFSPNRQGNPAALDNEILIKEMRRLAKKLKRTPSFNDMTIYGNYSGVTYHKRFGSLTNAQKAAGLKPTSQGKYPALNRDILIKEMRRLAAKLKRTPSITDIRNHRSYSATAYTHHFGSFGNAQKATGLIPNFAGSLHILSKKILLKELKQLARKLRRTPRAGDITVNGKHSATSYVKYFGSLSNAQMQAGLSPNLQGKPNGADKNILIDELIRLSLIVNATPTAREIEANGKYGVQSYYRHFGTLSNAQYQAGLVPNTNRSQKLIDKN